MSAAVAAAASLLADPAVKRRRVRLLVTIVLVGTVVSIAYHYAAGFYLELGYPRSTFLFIPGDHFNDWDNLYIFAQEFLRGVPGPFAYFPFAILTAIATTVAPMRLGMLVVSALFLVVLVLLLRGWVVDCEEQLLTKVQDVVILTALSYPVLMALDRANLEIVLFLLIAGFFYYLYEKDSPWLAALLLAAAISFKLYPATLLILLLAERRYKTLGLSILFTIGLTLVSTFVVTLLGGFSLADLWAMNGSGKEIYQRWMVVYGGGVQHGHTLWGVLRLVMTLSQRAAQGWQTTLYSVAAAVIFISVSVHAVFRETERWKRVLFAVAPSLLLPFVSADYTLIHMYFPLAFFLCSSRVSRRDTLYVILFAVLLIPVDYYYPVLISPGTSISVVVYAVALLALIVLALFDPDPSLDAPPEEAPAVA